VVPIDTPTMSQQMLARPKMCIESVKKFLIIQPKTWAILCAL